MIEISMLHPDDWQVIRSVRLRSLRDAPGAFTSSYRREAAFDEMTWRHRATTCQWFVAKDGRAAVGIAGGIDGWSDDPRDRELVGMWVAAPHRGQGAARLLLDAVGAWARSEGAITLRLGVREGNAAARTAYLHMGLISTGEQMTAVGVDDESIEILELDLTDR